MCKVLSGIFRSLSKDLHTILLLTKDMSLSSQQDQRIFNAPRPKVKPRVYIQKGSRAHSRSRARKYGCVHRQKRARVNTSARELSTCGGMSSGRAFFFRSLAFTSSLSS